LLSGFITVSLLTSSCPVEVPGIHEFWVPQDVDGRDKPGHDGTQARLRLDGKEVKSVPGGLVQKKPPVEVTGGLVG
jgi:hypothetical protein